MFWLNQKFSSNSLYFIAVEKYLHYFPPSSACPVVTETTGSVSGVSLTSELNEELNDLIQRFHNQLHDSQVSPWFALYKFCHCPFFIFF